MFRIDGQLKCINEPIEYESAVDAGKTLGCHPVVWRLLELYSLPGRVNESPRAL